ELLLREDILRSVFLEGAGTPATAAKRRPRNGRRPQPAADAPAVLEVRGLVKRFGGIRAVDDVDFTLRQGEILGLIGPNGAGKTTIFDLISGFLAPDAGRIIFHGVDVSSWSPDRRSWAGLGRSFQDAR